MTFKNSYPKEPGFYWAACRVCVETKLGELANEYSGIFVCEVKEDPYSGHLTVDVAGGRNKGGLDLIDYVFCHEPIPHPPLTGKVT